MKKVAICYDFDKTLSPLDMQSQGFVQDVGMGIDEFWEDVDTYSDKAHVELNLTYMLKMVEAAKKKGFAITEKYLNGLGKNITYYKGVDTWFDRINKFGLEHNVEVHHFILSSGLKEIIDGTTIVKNFDKVYASAFHYDENGNANWPRFVVNYTNKTQFLFRISKGVFDELDNRVNEVTRSVNYYIPYSNFIYLGDSDTDIPCMALLNQYGGFPVGVYEDGDKGLKKVNKLIEEKRIGAGVIADYSENSALEKVVKKRILFIEKA